MPVYLQALRGRTALETGFTLLPLAITGGISSTLAGRLYDRIGPRPLVGVGFAILMVNTWQLSLLQADTPISWIVILLALRGIALVTAVTIVAEVGTLSRFAKPRQLMGYSGAVASEDSSGERTRRGGITKTGNAHLRRVIVEALDLDHQHFVEQLICKRVIEPFNQTGHAVVVVISTVHNVRFRRWGLI